jgi:hypothetical protein
MEICLRNKLNDRLESAYGPDWFRPGKAPFQSDAVQAIADSIRGLDQARKPIVAGAIVAELSFGFWVALLGPQIRFHDMAKGAVSCVFGGREADAA